MISSTVNVPLTCLEELAENSLLQKEGSANSPVCRGQLRRPTFSAVKHTLVTLRPWRIVYHQHLVWYSKQDRQEEVSLRATDRKGGVP